jgi:pimeloyl-ACP methyl ester carboxylesterase
VRDVKARGASLKATEQPVDTGTAAGKCFLDMLGVFAEFETNLRRERQLSRCSAGTFETLKPDAQANLVRYIPKACLDFRALLEERTPLVVYRRLHVPLRLICGEHAPMPAELLARKLAVVMNPGALRIAAGAGHMGPVSHSDVVVRMIVEHIAASDPTEAWHRTALARRAHDNHGRSRAGRSKRRSSISNPRKIFANRPR